MRCKPVVDFFLGALSPSGFSGWFPQAAAEPGLTAFLIKAGPGCGKSTLMRKLGEADAVYPGPRGCLVERIHCSSDPDSLDGVLMEDVQALILDATAPHTLDCKYPGAAERVLSFYDTLDNAYLAANRSQVLALGRRNGALLQQASAHFALACALLARRRTAAAAVVDHDKLCRFTRHLASRTIPRRRGVAPGIIRHRLLSAPTPGGLTVFYDTIPQLAEETLYAIQDAYGVVSTKMLQMLADDAQANGYDCILCHCASDQHGKLDHLFVPALGLGFVTANTWHPMLFAGQRNLHASRFMDLKSLHSQRSLMNYQKRLAASLIDKTCAAQTEAKAVHDELERYYIQATDFDGVDAIRRKLEAELFGA